MIVLKPIIFYPDNAGCEATWGDRIQAPDVVIQEVPATLDEEGNVLTAAIPARTEAGQVTDTQLKCHSYHPTQIDMLRDKAAEFGTSLAEHNDLLNQWQSDYVPPPPAPIQVPQVITARQAKLVLLAAGLLDDVDAAVAAADRATQIEWEYCTEVRRDWPTLVALAAAMGISSKSLDGRFIEGATL